MYHLSGEKWDFGNSFPPRPQDQEPVACRRPARRGAGLVIQNDRWMFHSVTNLEPGELLSRVEGWQRKLPTPPLHYFTKLEARIGS